MKIRVVAENYIEKEHISKLREYWAEISPLTLKEKGCIEYTFNQDIEDETHFTFIETWENMESLKAHSESPHYQKIVPEVSKLAYKEGKVVLYKEF